MQDTDLADEATTTGDPDVIETTAAEQLLAEADELERDAEDKRLEAQRAAENAEIVRRPDVRPTHQGEHLIAGTDLAVVPAQNEMEAIAQLAVTFAAAGAVPKALLNRPNDVFLVLMTARDLGMGLTTAMRECHVIEGKVTISPKAKLAMVRQQGLGRIWPDPGNDGESATWYAERDDLPGVRHSYTFTKAMATAAKLLPGKDKSAWSTYPERMLSWRACGYLLDDVFSEVGTGLYSPDELGAVTDADGQAIIDVVGTAEPLGGMAAPRGHNQPPPPPEPPAAEDDLAALRTRIGALAEHSADARTALVALWTKPRNDDTTDPTLPPIQHLMAKQVKIADAMVASIEQRARRGEWGPWVEPSEPDQPGEPESATQPVSGDAGTPAADQSEAPADDEVQPDPGDVVRVVIAEVKAMEPDTVNEQCTARGIPTDGRLDTRRHALATAMIAERNGDA